MDRRFVVGDFVRLRAKSHLYQTHDVAPDEQGLVVGVDPDPPPTGPTYRMTVDFPRARVPYNFSYEFVLIKAAGD